MWASAWKLTVKTSFPLRNLNAVHKIWGYWVGFWGLHLRFKQTSRTHSAGQGREDHYLPMCRCMKVHFWRRALTEKNWFTLPCRHTLPIFPKRGMQGNFRPKRVVPRRWENRSTQLFGLHDDSLLACSLSLAKGLAEGWDIFCVPAKPEQERWRATCSLSQQKTNERWSCFLIYLEFKSWGNQNQCAVGSRCGIWW